MSASDEELLKEFEKMLNLEDNDYEELAKDASVSPGSCYHVWEMTGRSPVLDTEWFNCKKCRIKKEVYDKSINPKKLY